MGLGMQNKPAGLIMTEFSSPSRMSPSIKGTKKDVYAMDQNL